MKKCSFLILFALILLFSHSIQAETIKTNSGNTYTGTIQQVTPEFIEIKTKDGTFKIDKTEINNIDFTKLEPIVEEKREIRTNSFLPDRKIKNKAPDASITTNTKSRKIELEAQFNEINQKKRIISEESKLFNVLQDGVVTIESDSGSGSGFISEETGLIVTNHHVINDSLEYRVLFDEKTKVKAKLITASPEEDIAILYVNLDAYPAAKILKLATPRGGEPLAYVGEKVIAIGSPLHQQKIMTTGIVSKVKEDVIISDVNVNHGNSGGPLFNSLGEVIGINTFGDFTTQGGPGVSGIINITKALPIIEIAKSKILSENIKTPESTLLPVYPEKPFPMVALKSAMTKEYKINDYFYNQGPFSVTVVSPPVYYNKQSEIQMKLFKSKAKRQKKKSKDNNKQEIAAHQDLSINSENPFLELKRWAKNLGEFKPVIIVDVVPEKKMTGGSLAKVLLAGSFAGFTGVPVYPGQLNYKFKNDFYDMKLFVNGKFVEPIRRGRVLQQIAYSDYSVSMEDQTHCGCFTYSPDILLSKTPNVQNKIELWIYKESDISDPIKFSLKEQTISKLKEDFKIYFNSMNRSGPNTANF